MRRNLQREYVLRLANVLLRPAGALPADARALLRADATKLRAEIAQGEGPQGICRAEAKAHLHETLAHARRGAEGAADPRKGYDRAVIARRAQTPLLRSPRSTIGCSRISAGRSTPTCGRSRPRSTSRSRTAAGTSTIAGASPRASEGGRRRSRTSTRAPRSRCPSTTSSWAGRDHLAWSSSRRRRRSRRRVAAAAHAPARPSRAHAEPDAVPEGHPGARHHVRRRPGRNRQDLPRGRVRRRCAGARRSQAHRPRAPRSRGGRAARVSCPATSRRRSIRTCARCTTRCTT